MKSVRWRVQSIATRSGRGQPGKKRGGQKAAPPGESLAGVLRLKFLTKRTFSMTKSATREWIQHVTPSASTPLARRVGVGQDRRMNSS